MIVNCPINSVSFGQVSYNILKNLKDYKLFPIGNLDFSSFREEPEEQQKIGQAIFNSHVSASRKETSLKLWHISGLLESYSDKRAAITFHETDRLTDTEVNILNQLDIVFVTSNYTKSVFESQIKTKVVFIPLGFDSTHFSKVEVKRDDEIVFGLFGKAEVRKATYRILNIWAKVYGNNKKYKLNACIFNPFLSEDVQKSLINQALEGKAYWNINFLPSCKKNIDYNKVLNSIDIDLTGMSLCEGWNLPLFQTLCLGKQAVVLNAHAHKDFANHKNSFLVEPKGVIPAHDNVFFKQGGNFNQGNWFNFNSDDFIGAITKAEMVAKENNIEGEKLKEFTYKKTAEVILKNLESL